MYNKTILAILFTDGSVSYYDEEFGYGLAVDGYFATLQLAKGIFPVAKLKIRKKWL